MSHKNIDALSERFEKSLFILSKNLGPELIARTQLDLTPGQVFMLYFIQQENPCTVSTLAEKLEVSPSSITVMLDRLESHGFVTRVRSTNDRRVVITELTEKGKAKLNHVLGVRKQITQYCLEQVDVKELESFISTLESLASIAQAMKADEVLRLSNVEGK